jgi:hypothetical protein
MAAHRPGFSHVIKLRVFAVLAAAFLVIAVALGSILPADEPLSQIIADTDASLLPSVQGFLIRHVGGWAWSDVTVPVLVRPTWMIPLGLGILCLGAVTTLNWLQTPSRPRRRRS